jgi:hypothetical protein
MKKNKNRNFRIAKSEIWDSGFRTGVWVRSRVPYTIYTSSPNAAQNKLFPNVNSLIYGSLLGLRVVRNSEFSVAFITCKGVC